ncbi:hypothetical protein C2G38_2105546 [Gigaspora rosea]|uniref:Uncharacterized protein n=1 Tax=Gigaspora rosea TaxID=44941 RepID=A0A397UK76_9GLOM|nr:hypothetical protein C2G38_2105546 [Gigaspora rosea]
MKQPTLFHMDQILTFLQTVLIFGLIYKSVKKARIYFLAINLIEDRLIVQLPKRDLSFR